MKPDPLSLYLHIPFCSLKCRYCDFNAYAGLDKLVPPYVDALIAEMGLWRQAVRGRPVPTVFFGGGTPSLLPLPELERIIAALRDSFDLDPEAELTLEANPGTVDLPYLQRLLSLGVNRLSLGVQSFHDDELAALDRIHSAQDAKDAYLWARQAGFHRLSLDLIYGLSQQPQERWQATLEQAIELAPDHLSLYALTVEEGTGLAYDVDHGRVPSPDADAQASMYEWSEERLARAGYRQYEISNWARPVLSEASPERSRRAEGPGQECQHNLVYWRNGDWLGLGAGAHSHLDGIRFADVYSPRQYIRRLQQTAERGLPEGGGTYALLKAMGQVTYLEEGSPEMAMADTAILALRLNEGLNPAHFSARFGRTLEEVYGPTLAELTTLGLIESTDSRLRLTPRGRLLANEVFVCLLPD